jgi:hypothetical protein
MTTTTTGTLVLPCEVCRKPTNSSPRASATGRRDFVCLDHGDDSWHCFHYGCAPELPADIYWFPTYRVATAEDLLDKTASMLRTGWLGSTDWGDFIHRILRANNRENDHE